MILNRFYLSKPSVPRPLIPLTQPETNVKLYSVTNSESKERMRGRGTKNSNRKTKF